MQSHSAQTSCTASTPSLMRCLKAADLHLLTHMTSMIWHWPPIGLLTFVKVNIHNSTYIPEAHQHEHPMQISLAASKRTRTSVWLSYGQALRWRHSDSVRMPQASLLNNMRVPA